jgi:hypothetical protein
MVRHRAVRAAVVLLAAVAMAAAASAAEKVTSYTAEQVTLGPDGKELRTSRIAVSGDKVRIDGLMPQSGSDLVAIMRGDLKKHWVINLPKKSYFERDIEDQDRDKLLGGLNAMVKSRAEKVLGEERVGGYPCSKKEIETEVEVMGMKQKSRMLVWHSPRFDMPLRTRDEHGQVTEMRNIKEGAPPADVFELPAGFSKVAGMMQLIDQKAAAEDESAAEAPAAGKGGMPKLPPGVKLPPGFKMPPAPKQ